MSIDVRTMLRTALDESRAKTVRLEKALEALGGNRTQTAKVLGISVRTLRNKLNTY